MEMTVGSTLRAGLGHGGAGQGRSHNVFRKTQGALRAALVVFET